MFADGFDRLAVEETGRVQSEHDCPLRGFREPSRLRHYAGRLNSMTSESARSVRCTSSQPRS